MRLPGTSEKRDCSFFQMEEALIQSVEEAFIGGLSVRGEGPADVVWEGEGVSGQARRGGRGER